MRTYAIARLDEIDPMPDGRYPYRPVRHHLGIRSFGATAWVGAAAGDPIINEFDEGSEPADELFIVVSGRAIFALEGEEVDATPGTLVFTAPGTRRTAVAAEPTTTILVIDGTPGKPYAASGWELWAPLRPLYDAGEHTELSARLEDAHCDQSAVSDAGLHLGLQREPERPHDRRDRPPATRGLSIGEVPRRCASGLRLRPDPRRALVPGADRRVARGSIFRSVINL